MKLLETIRLKEGKLMNIEYHAARFNQARAKLFGITTPLDLSKFIQIPNDCLTGIYRCRLIYERDIEEISFTPYQFKSIQSLKIVEAPKIAYAYKWADRDVFGKLLQQNSEADEIIIVQNGLLTDCTFANLAFWDGSKWFTPDTPLLKGTKRAKLLKKKQIIEKSIRVSDVKNFQKVCLINAFLDLDLSKSIDVSSII